MSWFEQLVSIVEGVVWSPFLVIVCLGAGVFFSCLTRFVQIRMLGEMVRLLFAGSASKSGISPFQALVVSLSGRVGVGNIAGVAAAIGFGGPGAVFWMWAMTFLGASTAYAESTLAQIYKSPDASGQYRGGPAFYFERMLGHKYLSVVFALSAIIACGLFMPSSQSNAVIEGAMGSMRFAFSCVSTPDGSGAPICTLGGIKHEYWFISAICVSIALIILGGIGRIAKVTEFVVPFMAGTYILLAIWVMVVNAAHIPAVFGLILSDAFSPMAGLGAAIGWGVKRGIYSNEAGLGTGAHAAGAAEVEHPAQQGLVQAFSVYIDTLLVCSATAFMILSTGMYNVHNSTGGFFVQYVDGSLEPSTPAFTQLALSQVFGGMGIHFVSFSVFFFAFTTILAYYYIAEVNASYLLDKASNKTRRICFLALKLGFLGMVIYGGIANANLVWALGDIGLGIMAWVNILGLFFICYKFGRPTMAVLRDYERQKRQGVKAYTFDPKALDIHNATFWEQKK